MDTVIIGFVFLNSIVTWLFVENQAIYLLLEQGILASEFSLKYGTFLRNEVYRFNLELGQFLPPMESEAKELNCCVVNDYHQLLLCGTNDGRVEAFDHRDQKKVGNLDCALSTLLEYDVEAHKG